MGYYKVICCSWVQFTKNNDTIWKINLKLDLVNVYILKSSNKLSVMVELYKYKLDWNLFKSSSPLALPVFAYAHCKL